jgi:hypothetical protein
LKKLIALATALSFLALPAIALATTQPVDSVKINQQELQCVSNGSLNLTITGTATYDSQHSRLLVVKADGNDILNTNTKPTSWTAASHAFSVGVHTITATTYNHDNQKVVSDTWTFTVEKCVVPVATPSATVATPAATVLPNTGGWTWFNWIAGIVIIFGLGYLTGWAINKK